MTFRDGNLFAECPRAPRAKPRVLMYVSDAGDSHGLGAEFTCRKCGYETGWRWFKTISDIYHTPHPCPKCNVSTDSNSLDTSFERVRGAEVSE